MAIGEVNDVAKIHLDRNEICVLKQIKKRKVKDYTEQKEIIKCLFRLELITCKDCSIDKEDGMFLPNPPYAVSDLGKRYLLSRSKDVWRTWMPVVISVISLIASFALSMYSLHSDTEIDNLKEQIRTITEKINEICDSIT